MNYNSLTIVDGPVDLELLNRACIQFGTGQGKEEELDKIDKVLTKFTERPDNFNFCFPIINGNFHTFTKFFAYKLVRMNIINRWNLFADDEKEEIRNSILISIVQMIKEGQKQFTISMADQTLVEILKYDWPDNWPTFIDELLLTCQTEGIQFLKNALDILKRLAEEIPSSNSSTGATNIPSYITRDRQRSIKAAFIKELPTIYTIIENAFNLNQNSDELSIADINEINNKSLCALESLIPVVGTERLLDTPLVSGIAPLLMSDEFTFKVFSIFGKFCENLAQSDADNSSAQALEKSLLSVFQESIQKIYSIYSDTINFNCVETEDLLKLVDSVYNFLNLFIPIMDPTEYQEEVMMAINWIIQITTSGYIDKPSDDDEEFDDSKDFLFSEVIKFWHFFTVMFYRSASQDEASQFQDIYSDSLSQIIQFLVKNIVCPYSFVDVSSEYGNHIQKSLSLNTYESSLYDTMKEIFVVLYGLKKDELEEILSAEITSLQEGDFDSSTINSISWVLGSLSKAISDEENFNLMGEIIPVFLSLIENENPTNDPTIEEIKFTASKAMLFLCSQEAKYFRSNPEFLSSLMQLVFQFFTSDEPALNIIAIHTFTLLSKSCKQAFITPINESNGMILDDILESFLDLIDEMKPEHRCAYTAAVADLVRLLESKSEVHQMHFDAFSDCIFTIFNHSIFHVDDFLLQFQYMSQTIGDAIERFPDLETLSISLEYQFQQPTLASAEALKEIVDSISILSVLPYSLHSYFFVIFESFLPKLVSLYEYVTNNSTTINSTDFDAVTDQEFIKNANSTCDYYYEIANLISELFANVLKILKQEHPQFLSSIISSFLLGANFHALVPQSYPPKLFMVYSNLFHYTFNFDIADRQLQDAMTKMFNEIYDCVFTPATDAIKDEYDTLYDLRIGILNFIRGSIRGRPDLILTLSDEQIELFVQVLMWFTGHPYEEISGNAIEACFILINTFKTSSRITYRALVDTFWSKYFMVFVSQMFTLLSDSTYKFGFEGQTLVLSNLLQMDLNEEIINMIITNANEIFERTDCDALINELIPTATTLLEFRAILKDFLVQVKEYSATDLELCQIEIFKQRRKESLAGRVPGLEKNEMLTSGNIEEDMDSMDSIFKNLSL